MSPNTMNICIFNDVVHSYADTQVIDEISCPDLERVSIFSQCVNHVWDILIFTPEPAWQSFLNEHKKFLMDCSDLQQ